ncbi:peptide ABC transporter substrate-binding protein, partial [bacterium]|nr:peptide ABC transporter substrate-binding protein [bacterium]
MKRLFRLSALLLALALVVTACGDDDDAATTTAAPTTTAAVTTTEAPAAFVGASVEAPDCEYGGKVSSIKAVDELTVEFSLCAPLPAFPQIAAFTPFGIQPEEHLLATGG